MVAKGPILLGVFFIICIGKDHIIKWINVPYRIDNNNKPGITT